MSVTLSKVLDIIYTFLEIFCMYRYVDILYERRWGKGMFWGRRWWPFPGGLVICYVVIVTIMNNNAVSSPFTGMSVLVQSLLFVCIFWKCDILNAVAVVGGYFFILLNSGNIEMSLTYLIGGEELIQETIMKQGRERAVYLFLSGLNWFGVNTLFTIWLKKKKIDTSNMKYLAYISFIGLAGSLFIFDQALKSFTIHITITLYVFTILIGVCIFTVYFIMKNKNQQVQLRLLDEQNDMLERNYQQISEFYAANAGLVHDMRHHLNALEYMLKERQTKQAEEYIKSLKETSVSLAIKQRTGIDVVDVIISEMERRAGDIGIEMNVETQMLPMDIAIEGKDMCTLFANLLENAVEAAIGQIDVKIGYVHNMLWAQIRNDYRKEPVIKNGKLVTTKRDSLRHGLGTQNIERVVRKYEGRVEYKIQEGKFCVEILLSEKR